MMKWLLFILVTCISIGATKAEECSTCCKDVQVIKKMLMDLTNEIKPSQQTSAPKTPSQTNVAVNPPQPSAPKGPPPLRRDLPYINLPPAAFADASPPPLARKGTDDRPLSAADFK